MIEVLGVSKRYGTVEALKNVKLTVPKGRILGLLGQNGAGKTTLLNIITGCLAATEGRVLIDGHDSLTSPEEAKRNLGYMPELPPLYDEMTVEEFLSFTSALRKVPKKNIPAHIKDIMHDTGLTEMRYRLLGHLSKGYRQRAGLAQALCGNAEVLVLDEPTSGLDPKQITEIRSLIRRLAEGRTIIFSSHILPEVRQLCDRVVILHKGEVRLDADLNGMCEDSITVLCRIQGDERKLVSVMHHLEGIREVNVLPTAEAGEVSFSLVFDPIPLPEKHIFTLCSALGASIIRMTRHEDDLEQVFLQAIAE